MTQLTGSIKNLNTYKQTKSKIADSVFSPSTVDSRYFKIKGLSETLRDICTSTYQICGIDENINRTATINKLEYAADGAPSQIPTLVANVANSMTDKWTCTPIPLSWGEVM